jgi:excinuclease ABC subunit A
MEKPDVESIEGLSPAISIEQHTPSHNPRSTVGTVTEIYDYLRLLYARVGTPHCPSCGRVIKPQSAQQIIQEVMKWPSGSAVTILAPLIRGRIGIYTELFERLKKSGYARVRVDGQVHRLEESIKVDRYKKHTIELVVDRVQVSEDNRERISDSIEAALKESRGLVLFASSHAKEEVLLSEHYACVHCGISLPEIEPRLFSFNSPYGACSECDGLGAKLDVDEDLVVPDKNLSIADGALQAWSNPVTTRTHRWKRSWAAYYDEILSDVARKHHIP